MSTLVVLLAAMLALGSPLFCVVAVLVLGCLVVYGGTYDSLSSIFAQINNMVVKEELLAVPFFVLSGALITRGKIATRLIEFARALIGWLPGGLGISTVLACMFFAAISGSSPVTVIAIGSIMYPALSREGYEERFSIGLITSAGSLGILIPPSIPMIIFAILIGKDVQKLFIGGILPGVMLGGLLALYCVFKGLGSTAHRVPFSLKALVVASWRGKWAIMLPLIILGGIYGLSNDLPTDPYTSTQREWQRADFSRDAGERHQSLQDALLGAGRRALTTYDYHGRSDPELASALQDYAQQPLRELAQTFTQQHAEGVASESLLARLRDPALESLWVQVSLDARAAAVLARRKACIAELQAASDADQAAPLLRRLARLDAYYRLDRLRVMARERGLELMSSKVEELRADLSARAMDLALGAAAALPGALAPVNGMLASTTPRLAVDADEPWWVVPRNVRNMMTMTPTQASVVSVIYALLVEFLLPWLMLGGWFLLPKHWKPGRPEILKPIELPRMCVDSAKLLGTLFMILVLAAAFNHFLKLQKIPDQAAEWLESVIDSRIGFLLLVNLFLLAVGCVMDIMSAILILAPLLWPIADRFGMDPTHFGILFIVNLEIGYLTPPMGINLFVSASLFRKPLGTVIRGTLPFALILLTGLVLLMFIPSISTGLIGGGRAQGPEEFRISAAVLREGEPLELSWTAEPRAHAYEVEASRDPDFGDPEQVTRVYGPGPDLECVYELDGPGTWYLRLRSANEDGASLWQRPTRQRERNSAGKEVYIPLRSATGAPIGVQVTGAR